MFAAPLVKEFNDDILQLRSRTPSSEKAALFESVHAHEKVADTGAVRTECMGIAIRATEINSIKTEPYLIPAAVGGDCTGGETSAAARMSSS